MTIELPISTELSRPTPTLPRRALFVATILTGSVLLFMVQPMVARMALPRLGGAPAVWNSAMLVYQALLLGGYAWAHWLGRFAVRKQAAIHLALLLVAALWLPVGLANLAPPAAGSEAFWVPLFLTASIGPVFFAVAAQAPLMQRWFAADPKASDPYALYAASNLGSFAGLLAYPLLVEPNTSIAVQSWGWSAGYALLVVLVALAAKARWALPAQPKAERTATPRPPLRRMLLWLALAAVPSGLMLSTTTHLTTDVFAMPLLWVIPLGLYLLSFVVAFAEKRGLADVVTLIAPPVLLAAGGLSLMSVGNGSMLVALGSLVMLFTTAVALHTRMYRLRPAPSQLTLFYMVMSAGGALGGLFAALIAPLLFDWVYEHPILVLAAALLLPMPALFPWADWLKLERRVALGACGVLVAVAALATWHLSINWTYLFEGQQLGSLAVILVAGLLAIGWRYAFAAILALMMLSIGGFDTIRTSLDGARTRSYFGVYTVRDYADSGQRTLAHGTTLHGTQRTTPGDERQPTTYYGPTSGVGLTLDKAETLFGPAAKIGVVGLGTGTLACYKKPGQSWQIFEIDPAIVTLARDSGTFTFMPKCAPDAKILLGDARLELAKLPPGQLDILAIDAFSSDAIPLHLLTSEALAIYARALRRDGILLIHISNRYFDLEPVLAAEIRRRGWYAGIRVDEPDADGIARALTASSWVAIAANPARLDALDAGDEAWSPLASPGKVDAWTDDYASILPVMRWDRLTGFQE